MGGSGVARPRGTARRPRAEGDQRRREALDGGPGFRVRHGGFEDASLAGRRYRGRPHQFDRGGPMADPLRPTLMTKVRASLGGERDAGFLEALRSAGRVAYDELMA